MQNKDNLKSKYIEILNKYSGKFGDGALTDCLDFYHAYGYLELNSDQIKFYLINVLKVSEEVLS